MPEPVSLGRDVGQTVGTDWRVHAQFQGSAPVMVKGDAVDIFAVRAEGVQIGIAHPAPVDELDTELERCVCRPHELGLVDPELLIECLDCGYGGFANSHRADLVGFDQSNPPHLAVKDLRQHCGGHPASGAAADDDDVL